MQDQETKTLRVERTYILLQAIGEGAYGTVYDAFEPWSGQHAAIKVLKADFAGDTQVCNRFEDEAVLTAFIDHPSTLPVYGAGSDKDGCPFYVMKKVQGRTLESLLQERGTQVSNQEWIARLLAIFSQACEGLAAAHEHGVIHRDLKPENIIVSDQDYVNVLDWGLARRCSVTGSYAHGTRTMAGAVMGSPGYMAPEQARGDSDKAGPQADVFALGVILYRILTSVQPFEGKSPRESLLNAIYRDPQDPRRLNPWVSPRLAAITRKALEKNEAKRYASARDLADDLQAYREGHSVSVARLSLREWVQGWARRQPGRALTTAAIGTVLLLAALIIGGQFWLDARLAEKTFERVAQLDAENDAISEQLKVIVRNARQSGTDEALRMRQEALELRIRHFLNEHEALALLEEVVRMRFIRARSEAVAAVKTRRALIHEAQKRETSGPQQLRLSAADRERLEALDKAAGAALRREIEKNNLGGGG
jgi:hypothetical protein